jgi:protein-disulfide isomerase
VAGLPVSRAGICERGDGRQGCSGAREVGEYHDLLYQNQAGGFPDEKLAALAREAGLDEKRFESDLASGEYDRAVAEDFREGQQRGISGTPTFVINGRVLAGLQPVGVYENAIEQARREAEGSS